MHIPVNSHQKNLLLPLPTSNLLTGFITYHWFNTWMHVLLAFFGFPSNLISPWLLANTILFSQSQEKPCFCFVSSGSLKVRNIPRNVLWWVFSYPSCFYHTQARNPWPYCSVRSHLLVITSLSQSSWEHQKRSFSPCHMRHFQWTMKPWSLRSHIESYSLGSSPLHFLTYCIWSPFSPDHFFMLNHIPLVSLHSQP